MKIAMTGGTGTVGTQVVNELISRKIPVKVLVRNQEKASGLPEGAEPALGELEKPETLRKAFEGADALFLLTPLDPNETQLGLNAVRAAREAGVRKIVYMTVYGAGNAPHIPHFGSKLPVAEAIKESGVKWATIEPNNFFQNDLWLREPMMQYGVYPQPLGNAGTNRVDVRDIAESVAAALTQNIENGGYPVNGPEVLTAEDVASIWSKHLNRPIQYGGDDLDAWSQQASTMMPEWMVRDLRIMYDHFQKHGLKATDEDLRRQEILQGHAPRKFEDWVAETAPHWF